MSSSGLKILRENLQAGRNTEIVIETAENILNRSLGIIPKLRFLSIMLMLIADTI